VRDVFVDRLWSGFAQLEVNLAPGVLDAVAAATVLGAVLVAAVLVRRRAAVRRHAPLAAVLAVAVVGMLWTLHVAAWRDLQLYGDPIITGRYLTPLLPIAGLGVAVLIGALPRAVRPAGAALVLGAEGLLAVAALGAAMVRFHV
jgi:hypothetical protein